MKLQIITPAKLVKEVEVSSVTLPTEIGQITILPKHQPILTHLEEGIASYTENGKSIDLAVGGGFAQTDGQIVKVLVTRAYGQDEVDEKFVEDALSRAQKLLSESKDQSEREEAKTLIRRSVIDSKLLRRRRSTM